MNSPYAPYDVLDKWDTVSFDTLTRGVLARRLHTIPPRRFLSESEWTLLDAIAAHLTGQSADRHPIPITPWIDQMLDQGAGEGFRHDDMPALQIAWRHGLAAIDAEAQQRFSCGFTGLDEGSRDRLFQALAGGKVTPVLWMYVPAQRFFTQVLLKTVVGIFYAHPSAWSEIGFGGPASPRGYVRLGFGDRDEWEAREHDAYGSE